MVCYGISGVVNSRLPMKKMKPMLQKTRESFCMEGYSEKSPLSSKIHCYKQV